MINIFYILRASIGASIPEQYVLFLTFGIYKYLKIILNLFRNLIYFIDNK